MVSIGDIFFRQVQIGFNFGIFKLFSTPWGCAITFAIRFDRVTRKTEGLEWSSKEFLFIVVVWLDVIHMVPKDLPAVFPAFTAKRFFSQVFLSDLFPTR